MILINLLLMVYVLIASGIIYAGIADGIKEEIIADAKGSKFAEIILYAAWLGGAVLWPISIAMVLVKSHKTSH